MSETQKDLKEVFKAAVKERLSLHPNQWAGEDSAAVTLAMISEIRDKDGNPIALTEDEKAIIELASRPTNKLQVKVISAIISRLGGVMKPEAVELISKVVGPTAFKTALIKAGHIKDTGESGLENLLS